MTTSDTAPTSSYSGALELWTTDGQLLGVLHVSIADLDAPVWSAESTEPINVRDIDPGGETITAHLADPAHPRSGDLSTAHLELRNQRLRLAGNYGFHAPDSS
jgi:hypothetical protein